MVTELDDLKKRFEDYKRKKSIGRGHYFPKDLKNDIIKCFDKYSISKLSRHLDIPATTIYCWKSRLKVKKKKMNINGKNKNVDFVRITSPSLPPVQPIELKISGSNGHLMTIGFPPGCNKDLCSVVELFIAGRGK